MQFPMATVKKNALYVPTQEELNVLVKNYGRECCKCNKTFYKVVEFNPDYSYYFPNYACFDKRLLIFTGWSRSTVSDSHAATELPCTLIIIIHISLKSLEVNIKFKIKSFSKCSTAYDEKVFVNLEESKTILPQRFSVKFTNEMIENLNDEIRNGKIIYLISEGIAGKTVNVKFVEE
jgi:hypothetical protein